MKILFTGGGSGGHFYPIIAVVEQIERIVAEEKLIRPKFYYMAPEPTNESLLFEHNIEFIQVPAGKLRIYPSIKNITDIFKTLRGMTKAFFKMFSIFPDVVFGKGGYASFPALFVARIFRIPIVIHESDSVPGRTNSIVGKFADRIAVSYAEASKYFPAKRVAWTGQPIRQSIRKKSREEGEKFFQLENNLPVLLVLGGSLGAEKINELILNSLPKLLLDWQIIHQTGKANIDSVKEMMSVVVQEDFLRRRYHAFDFLPDSVLALAAGVADLVVSRAGSTLFEIASWGLPSIVIPIQESNGDHQRQNAFYYSQSGSAIVIEEANLNSHIFVTEVEKLKENKALRESMIKATETFSRGDAAFKIARGILDIALAHEK